MAAIDRIIARLAKGHAELSDLEADCFVSCSNTRRVLYLLHSEGRIHIAKWRPVTIGGGYPAKVWAIGPGKDAKRPATKDRVKVNAESKQRMINKWTDIVGRKTALRMVASRQRGGVERLVIDGKVVYERKTYGHKSAP